MSGKVSFGNNQVHTTGIGSFGNVNVSSGTGTFNKIEIGNITIENDKISSTSNIDFDNENLKTTGLAILGNINASTGIGTFNKVETQNIDINGMAYIKNDTDATNLNTAAVVIEGGLGVSKDVIIGKNLTVSGNLNVQGNVNSINTTEIYVEDNAIILNSKGADLDTSEGGIILKDGNNDRKIVWDGSASWLLNENLTLDNTKHLQLKILK